MNVAESAIYSELHERPHEPVADSRDWQESILFGVARRVVRSGWLLPRRLRTASRTRNLNWGIFTRDGTRFRHHEDDMPYLASDRLIDGFAAGPNAWVRCDDGVLRHVAVGSGCSLELEFIDFHPRFRLPPFARDDVPDGVRGHFEVSGRVVGLASIASRRLEIDGLFHRDHSWGVRSWSSILVHRWMVGTFGPDLSFQLMTLCSERGGRTGAMSSEMVFPQRFETSMSWSRWHLTA